VVQLHHPGYCAFYAYSFYVGCSFSLLPLAEEFCRYYGIYTAQLSPYIYKLICMLTKYVELAGRGISLRHLMHLFAPNFYIGMMLHLRHRGSKSLVVKIDDKANRQFWLSYFFVKTEDVVANANGFPEVWNYARKYLLLSAYFSRFDCSLTFYLFLVQLRLCPLLWLRIFTTGLDKSCLTQLRFVNGRSLSRSLGPSFQ